MICKIINIPVLELAYKKVLENNSFLKRMIHQYCNNCTFANLPFFPWLCENEVPGNIDLLTLILYLITKYTNQHLQKYCLAKFEDQKKKSIFKK